MRGEKPKHRDELAAEGYFTCVICGLTWNQGDRMIYSQRVDDRIDGLTIIGQPAHVKCLRKLRDDRLPKPRQSDEVGSRQPRAQ